RRVDDDRVAGPGASARRPKRPTPPAGGGAVTTKPIDSLDDGELLRGRRSGLFLVLLLVLVGRLGRLLAGRVVLALVVRRLGVGRSRGAVVLVGRSRGLVVGRLRSGGLVAALGERSGGENGSRSKRENADEVLHGFRCLRMRGDTASRVPTQPV